MIPLGIKIKLVRFDTISMSSLFKGLYAFFLWRGEEAKKLWRSSYFCKVKVMSLIRGKAKRAGKKWRHLWTALTSYHLDRISIFRPTRCSGPMMFACRRRRGAARRWLSSSQLSRHCATGLSPKSGHWSSCQSR